MTTTSKINPKHYEVTIKGHTFQVADIMEAHFAEDMHLANAFKYMMRAGRKTGASYLEDVGKCVWWCIKGMMYHGAKHIELPPNAPVGNKVTTVRKTKSSPHERKTP